MNAIDAVSGGSGPHRPPLDGHALRGRLAAPGGPYSRVEVVAETGSTNADLAAYAVADPANWPDLGVLASDYQSAGKGRLERTWQAPPRSSLAASILFRPPAGFDAGGYPWLSMLCALALADSLADATGIPMGIKWPNDVLAGGKKVAGILAQLVAGGAGPAVVVGSGVNISLQADELPVPTATSLLVEGARTTDTTRLLGAYLERVAGLYRSFLGVRGDAEAPFEDAPHGLRRLVAERLATLGAEVRAELPGGTVLEGRATALEPDGGLLIRRADGTTTTVRAGDVVHLRRADGRYA